MTPASTNTQTMSISRFDTAQSNVSLSNEDGADSVDAPTVAVKDVRLRFCVRTVSGESTSEGVSAKNLSLNSVLAEGRFSRLTSKRSEM